MKNSADQGGCYPQRPKAEVDNTLRNLQNSSYPTKAECNNCFIIHLKYLLVLKGVSPFCSLFFPSPNITQPCPQVFAVNGSIICSGLHFWHHFDINGSIIFRGLHFWCHRFNMAKILSKFGEQQLVMVNYACGFNQSEMGKHFEWIIINFQLFQPVVRLIWNKTINDKWPCSLWALIAQWIEFPPSVWGRSWVRFLWGNQIFSLSPTCVMLISSLFTKYKM